MENVEKTIIKKYGTAKGRKEVYQDIIRMSQGIECESFDDYVWQHKQIIKNAQMLRNKEVDVATFYAISNSGIKYFEVRERENNALLFLIKTKTE